VIGAGPFCFPKNHAVSFQLSALCQNRVLLKANSDSFLEAIMEIDEHMVVLLELKYCERCGGLWVRQLQSDEIYCASCALEMSEVAIPRKRKNISRLPGNRHSDMSAPGPRLLLCRQGGKA